MAHPERVVLIDGSNLVYRAFFALPGNLMTSSGLKTNAILGFATMFRKLFAAKTPALGAVVFDAPGKTFRDEKFPQYKATRERMPDDLRAQLPHVHRVCEAHGFRTLRVPGVEADDVIGTLTRLAVEAGHEVHIISTDKDFAQLVRDEVRLVDTLRDVTFDAEVVRKRWGVAPAQFIDYLALVGDKIDNVPGVLGVGAKGAAQLLAAHGSLDGVYAHLEDLGGRRRGALERGRQSAYLSRELVTIDQHLTLPVTLDDLRIEVPSSDARNRLYISLELYSLIDEAGREALSASGVDTRHRRVGDVDALRALLAGPVAEADGPVAVVPVFDEEPPAIAPLVGVALATEPGRAWYLPLQGRGATLGGRGLAILARWLGDARARKVCHDAKALWRGLARADVGLAGVAMDVRLASFLIDPTRVAPHRLDQLTKVFLRRTIRPAKSVIGSGRAQARFSEADPEALTAWACHLADAVVSMTPEVVARLDAAGLSEHLRSHDLPLSWVLGRMELDGILVDRALLEAVGEELRGRLEGLETRVHALAGKTFNVASTKQLAQVLFEDLGLPVIKRTKTGYSTNAEVLDKLSEAGHEIADAVLAWRTLSKLINTYTDVLTRSIHEGTGRIHATYQQTAAATGRLITTDPDLQRTPTATPEGRRIREAFVAPRGHRLLSADWSQIELRLLAHFSQDEGLIEAFERGHDVHRRTAAKLFGVALEAVTGAQRQVGKTVNFATIYGQGATALGKLLKVPRKQAKAYIDGYFRHYAGVRGWLDRTVERALQAGYVTTMLGRRRYIPELSSRSPMERQAGMRIAANTPIQGSAADLCKLAMLDIAGRLEAQRLRAKMLLQIHDELLFEVPEAEVDAVRALVRDAMEHAADLSVPLVVDVGIGASWAQAH